MNTSEPKERTVPRVDGFGTLHRGNFEIPAPAARFVGFGIVLIAAFFRPLLSLIGHVASSNLHSYILLVPVIVAYLLYIRRHQLPRKFASSPGLAVISLLGGLLALASAVSFPLLSHNDHLTLMTLAFVCFLIAGGFFFLGRMWMVAAAFPVSFLIFLVPMPDAMADMLETASKLASAEATNLFFNMTNTPVMREGTIFQLPNIAIEVAQECSGIRSSLVLVITSLVAANLFLKSPWRRAVLVCFVIPLGIVRNGFRVWVIGSLCTYYGPQMIHSIVHRRGGPLFFGLSLIPLFLMLWWLQRGEGSSHTAKKSQVSNQITQQERLADGQASSGD